MVTVESNNQQDTPSKMKSTSKSEIKMNINTNDEKFEIFNSNEEHEQVEVQQPVEELTEQTVVPNEELLKPVTAKELKDLIKAKRSKYQQQLTNHDSVEHKSKSKSPLKSGVSEALAAFQEKKDFKKLIHSKKRGKERLTLAQNAYKQMKPQSKSNINAAGSVSPKNNNQTMVNDISSHSKIGSSKVGLLTLSLSNNHPQIGIMNFTKDMFSGTNTTESEGREFAKVIQNIDEIKNKEEMVPQS